MKINALLILLLAFSSEAVAGKKIELTSGLELNLDAFINANIIGLSHQEKGSISQLSIGRLIEDDGASSLERELSEQGFEVGEDCSSAKYFYYSYPETLMRVF